MDGRTGGWTDGQTDGRTDGRTHPIIEMRERKVTDKNKYRGGTSDATTLLSFIVSLFRMPLDFSFEKNTGRTERRTDIRTDGKT